MANKMAGVDVLLYVQTGVDASQNPIFKVVGGQSGANLKRSAKVIDTTSKDLYGWVENVSGTISWSLECEGFMMEGDEALDKIDDAFANRETMVAEIRLPSGKKFTGTCIISEFPYEFPLDGAATYKLTLTGAGALAKVTA